MQRSAGLAHDVYLPSGAVFRAQEQRAAAGEFLVTQLAPVPVLAGA
ncbi:MAG: hypothetical protein ACTMHL_12875 [Janibacter sp.]